MKKGQIVYKSGGAEKEIEKIGRKYLYLKYDNGRRYFIDTLIQDTTIGSPDRIYLTKEDYNSALKRGELLSYMRRFKDWNKLSTSQLEDIIEIIR